MITAFVYRDVIDPRLVGWVELAKPLLGHGQSTPVTVPLSSPITQIQLQEVIYADGTYVGQCANPSDGKGEDIVESIFEWPQAQAQEWVKWQQKIATLPQDDDEALQIFLSSALNAPKIKVATSDEEAAAPQPWTRLFVKPGELTILSIPITPPPRSGAKLPSTSRKYANPWSPGWASTH